MNPAAYPPLLHSSRLLAKAGWQVDVLGVAMGGSESFRFPEQAGVTTTLWSSVQAGRARQFQYARFVAAAIQQVARTRPKWVYASDPFAAPVAVAVQRLGLARVVYHEHDAPGFPASPFMRAIVAARRRAARTADLLIVPNGNRLDRLVAESGRKGPSLCVWNVPGADEVGPPRAPLTRSPTLYYHGTLNSSLLPATILDAMARVDVPLRLHAVGYETIGSRGFTSNFLREACRLGLADRVQIDGPADRANVMASAREADIGLAMMPTVSGDLNMQAMAGASNKAFDYLAGGLALVVSDLPDWRDLYVESAYAVAVDPTDPTSLATAFAGLASDPVRLRTMGESGRQQITDEWNYDRRFQPVIDRMTADAAFT